MLAIPVAWLLLFGAYRVLRFPVKQLVWSEEMYEYFDCAEKAFKNLEESIEATKKGIELPPSPERCERPKRVWKWQ